MSRVYRASCDDCGWVSNPCGSEGQAAYALRRHSCAKHRADLGRAERVAARKAAAGPRRDCTCPETHHDHGTRNAYVVDRCRCRACRDAASAYERRRVKDRLYGREAYVDATPAREHIRQLQAEGMGWKRIARRAGLETSVVWNILYGDPQRGRKPSRRVMPKTRDAILAVSLDLAPGAIVDGTGTRRRLQALVTLGWSMSELGRRLGVSPSNTAALVRGTDRDGVTVATHDAVTCLYDRLWDQSPPPSGWRGSVPGRARAYARRMGWAPPLAWDDDTIDDPQVAPEVDEITDITRRGWSRVNADSLHDCACRWGMTMQQTADRLDVTYSAIDVALRRLERDGHDVDTLRSAFARNATAQGLDRPSRDGLGLRRSA